MNEELIKLIEQIFQDANIANNTLWTVIIIGIINIIVMIVNGIIQFVLKHKDKLALRYDKIQDRSIVFNINIYNKLVDISSIDESTHQDVLLHNINQARDIISHNRLLLSKNEYKAINAILDYYIVVLGNPSHKDYKKENDLFEKYNKEFRK